MPKNSLEFDDDVFRPKPEKVVEKDNVVNDDGVVKKDNVEIINIGGHDKAEKIERAVDESNTGTTIINVCGKSLETFRTLLKDPVWMESMLLDTPTCAILLDVINELESNGGSLSSGRKSADGFVMHNCPKHDVAPINKCVKCEFWTGGKTTSGSCISPEDEGEKNKYDDLEKLTHREAKNNEIAYRKEHGRYFGSK